jgi:hypothetical protein
MQPTACCALVLLFLHAVILFRVRCTARSGDPDLLVSATSSTPHCARVTDAYYT